MGDRSSVMFAVAATAVLITADQLYAGKSPTPRAYVGIAGAGILLVLTAGPAPAIARGLAWLMFAAVLLERGPRIARRLGR
jgi:hypothetical protein